jgi:hypothetical protein
MEEFMIDERIPYIKPQLLVLEQISDVRVSMTNNCKGPQSGNGAGAPSGCNTGKSFCRDVS